MLEAVLHKTQSHTLNLKTVVDNTFQEEHPRCASDVQPCVFPLPGIKEVRRQTPSVLGRNTYPWSKSTKISGSVLNFLAALWPFEFWSIRKHRIPRDRTSGIAENKHLIMHTIVHQSCLND